MKFYLAWVELSAREESDLSAWRILFKGLWVLRKHDG